MAGMCCGVNIGETEAAAPVQPKSKSARRKRMEIRQFNLASEEKTKRQKLEDAVPVLTPRECENAVQICNGEEKKELVAESSISFDLRSETESPKFGTTSVCGRRRDMEDAIAIHPSFSQRNSDSRGGLHFFGVYDGHGCSHVALRCKDRMHEIVKDEFENGSSSSWEDTMLASFSKMDKEVAQCLLVENDAITVSNCRCQLQTPQSDAVGSTAVVAVVTRNKIVVSNCGDSRAVLCRNGTAIPLSVDHKPDRPDELDRIEQAGGRVIFWDGPRVLGVLAMSRAIGDNYLKPYVISEPEVTVTDRSAEDECLILASDGLWDVVSNETACGVARMCLQSRKPPSPPRSPGNDIMVTEAGEGSNKACLDASILLTKLALARHSTDNVSVVVVDLRKSS